MRGLNAATLENIFDILSGVSMRRLISTLTILLLIAHPTLSADYSIIREGQRYELDVSFQFTNPSALVLKKGGGKVMIEILEGDRKGEVLWVSPGKLLTTDQSRKQEAENVVDGLSAAAALLCALSKNCDPNNQKKSTPRNSNPDQNYPRLPLRQVQFANTCNKTIDVWLAYRNNGGLRGSNAYWTIKPDESFSIRSSGKTVFADSDQMWVFAKAKDESLQWSGGRSITLAGKKTLDMQKANVFVRNNRWQISFNCD